MLSYKGFYSDPQYSPSEGIYYGKILGISDLVDFYAASPEKIESEFHIAVDDYIAFCKATKTK